MTDKQFEYLQKLIANFDEDRYMKMEIDYPDNLRKKLEELKQKAADKTISSAEASKLIDFFQKYQLPKAYAPRYIRAKYDGVDAETGEPFKAGDLIYYSPTHGGYCKADNY